MGDYIKKLIVFTLFTTFVFTASVYFHSQSHFTKVEERISSIIANNNFSLLPLCNISGCDVIVNNGTIYELDKVKSILMPIPTLPKIFTSSYPWSGYPVSYTISLPEVNTRIYIDTRYKVVGLVEQYAVLLLIAIMVFSLYYLNNRNIFRTHNKLLLLTDKFKLEGKLQLIIAESAHHEMMTPVATIKTSITEVTRLIENNNLSNKGCSCARKAYDNRLYEAMGIITDSVCRLEAVLTQMSDSKQTKYGSSTKSFYDLIQSSGKSLQIFHTTSNFEIEVRNVELLKNCRPSLLSNGVILNILNNLIKNAVEAGASKVVFDAKKKKNSSNINIYIVDNGMGIPSIYNGYHDNVFKLGYTSKEDIPISLHSERSVILGYIQHTIKGLLGRNLNTHTSAQRTTRGVGLYLAKEILNMVKGDIEIISTSPDGTSFRITTAVKNISK